MNYDKPTAEDIEKKDEAIRRAYRIGDSDEQKPKTSENREVKGQIMELRKTLGEVDFQLTAAGFRLDKLEDIGETQAVEELRPLVNGLSDSLEKVKNALEKYLK